MCPSSGQGTTTSNSSMGNLKPSGLNNYLNEINQTPNSETSIHDSSQYNNIENTEQVFSDLAIHNKEQARLQNQTHSNTNVNLNIGLINENNLADEISMDVDISNDVIQHSEDLDVQVTNETAIIIAPQIQIDEAVGGTDPVNNFEISRILSYPDNFSFKLKSYLAKLGFYYIQNSVSQCQFCNTRIEVTADTNQNLQHTCEKINNIALPQDTSNYRYEGNRLLSFLKVQWNKKTGRHPVGALELARWGFFYIGEPDASRCTFCRLEIRGWEQGDTAESEHRRWNPECPFVSGRVVGNVKLGEELLQQNVVNDCASVITNNHSDELMVKLVEETKLIPVIPPKHPQYRTVQSRQASYEIWPRSMKQRPESLSVAGFYYTGKGDRVICFQCGGGLKDWGGKDPWVEHAYWFPQCMYLNLRKGDEFTKKVQDLKNQELNKQIVINQPRQEQQVIKKETVEPAIAEIPSFRQCKVCMDKELSIVFLPCGHMAACTDCAPQLTSCPVCRGKLAAYVRAFFT